MLYLACECYAISLTWLTAMMCCTNIHQHVSNSAHQLLKHYTQPRHPHMFQSSTLSIHTTVQPIVPNNLNIWIIRVVGSPIRACPVMSCSAPYPSHKYPTSTNPRLSIHSGGWVPPIQWQRARPIRPKSRNGDLFHH